MLREAGKETTYDYNVLNQLISKRDMNVENKYQYDRRGNLINVLENGKSIYRYFYSELNRLEEAENEDGEKARYIYNGLGCRTGKEIMEKNPGRVKEQYPEKRIQYVLDLTRRYHNLLEREENGHTQTYLWDGTVAGMSKSEEETYYLQDELGSPIRLVNMEGNLAESYGYDEFGQDLYGNQGKTQPFGYTGYQYDGTAGTYFAQAREYQAGVGRFISKDKNRYIRRNNIRTINQYVYCESNPLNNIDPMGFDLEDHYNPQPGNNDPIQVRVRGNTVTIDAYVDIKGDTETEIENTTVHDLTVEGIERWGGNYDNVFGHNTEVTVNVHEGHKPWYWWLPWVSNQNYVSINLQDGAGRATTMHSVPWDRAKPGYIDMFTHRSDGEGRDAFDF